MKVREVTFCYSEVDSKFDEGALRYARWFGKTLDHNQSVCGWSHPVLVKLAKRAIGKDKGYVHSSQITALRTGTLKSPGPRSFANLVVLFQAIDDFQKGAMKPGAPDFSGMEKYIKDAKVMRDQDGNVADLGFHFDVFVGWREPPAPDFTLEISMDEAEAISQSAGKYIRNLMIAERMDLIDTSPGNPMDRIKKAFSGDPSTQQEFADVILGQAVWSPDDIDSAMNSLSYVIQKIFKEKLKPEQLLKLFRS